MQLRYSSNVQGLRGCFTAQAAELAAATSFRALTVGMRGKLLLPPALIRGVE